MDLSQSKRRATELRFFSARQSVVHSGHRIQGPISASCSFQYDYKSFRLPHRVGFVVISVALLGSENWPLHLVGGDEPTNFDRSLNLGNKNRQTAGGDPTRQTKANLFGGSLDCLANLYRQISLLESMSGCECNNAIDRS